MWRTWSVFGVMADTALVAVVVVAVVAADIGGEINSPSSNRDSVSWSNQCFSCCAIGADVG
jgi:hypothetical protein